MSNLSLWNAVVSTDPAYTKQFSRGGGFKGTATNFVYLARKATEQFGECGIGWGSKVLDEKYQPGALLKNGQHEIIHVVRIEFWYLRGEKVGSIEAYGQTTFVGENKNGVFTDEEAPKKSLTDAMSKAMSWLGFAADIHLGLYEDNKYVSNLKQESAGKTATIEEEPPRVRVSIEDWKAVIDGVTDADEWKKAKSECFTNCTDLADPEAWATLKDLLAKKAKALKLTKEQVNGK